MSTIPLEITVHMVKSLSETENKPLKEYNENDVNEVLLSMETLRESPVQWPEKLPGMADFLTMSDTPIHMQNIENSEELTSEDIEEMNKLAAMSPEELAAKIQILHDQVFQLGIREAEEMTRGKVLGIFNLKGRRK